AHTTHEVGQYPSPRKTHDLEAGVSPVSMAITHYAQQIDGFSDFYDRGDLLLLTLEQLARDPAAVLSKVCKFLEIKPLGSIETSLKSNDAESRSSSQSRYQNLYSLWQSFRGLAPLRHAAKIVVPKAVRARVYRVAKASAGPEGRFLLTADEAEAVIAAL